MFPLLGFDLGIEASIAVLMASMVDGDGSTAFSDCTDLSLSSLAALKKLYCFFFVLKDETATVGFFI